MAKFIYLYRGQAPDLTPEQGAERMAAFAAWMEKLGGALVDPGSPFGAGTSVVDDGTERNRRADDPGAADRRGVGSRLRAREQTR
jgi:hypothetical protein